MQQPLSRSLPGERIGSILKQATGQESALTEQELEAINTFTRRPLKKEEVYQFNLILCDNEIDRDEECFPTESLHALAPLFLGKTGLFDHQPCAENQTARIYHTEVITDPTRKTSYGAPYAALRAKAYLMRCEKNRSLMDDIDAGIKKEISVGCSVAQIRCSICGVSQKGDSCSHIPGTEYDGARCYHTLEEPTDAYEWSFVAVPAQREAGVTKTTQRELPRLKKAFSQGSALTLTAEEAASLQRHWQTLEEDAGSGRLYRKELQKRVLRLSCLCGDELPAPMLASLTARMSTEELKAFEQSYEKRLPAKDSAPIRPQLAKFDPPQDADSKNESFKI